MTRFIDQLRPASFRGVSFDVPDDENAFGNRVARYEYPGRDGAGHDPLGLSVEAFTLTAVIIGADFLTAAAALRTALKKAGAGQLIHPHHGEKNVLVIDVREQHSSSAIGEVRFQITFEEYQEPEYPTSVIDTASALGLSSSNLFATLEGEFNSFFNGNIPDFLTADALTRVNSYANQLQGLLAQGGVLNLIGGVIPQWQSIGNGFAGSVVNLFSSIANLAKPKAKPVIGTARAVSATPRQVKGIMTAMVAASDVSIRDEGTPATSTGATRQRNATALDNLMRGAALASMGAAARYATYESREEAVAFRQAAADRLSSLRDDYGTAGWDASWRVAGQQLAALSRDINDRIGRLPRTLVIRPQAVRSSVALAHRLYGDDRNVVFDQAADLVSRNRVRHPGFVPASEMEVLIDA